jgi:hypothetical protein
MYSEDIYKKKDSLDLALSIQSKQETEKHSKVQEPKCLGQDPATQNAD